MELRQEAKEKGWGNVEMDLLHVRLAQDTFTLYHNDIVVVIVKDADQANYAKNQSFPIRLV